MGGRSNSNRHKKHGSGLVLSICKVIVDKLSGSIGFESVEGNGADFSIALPCGRPDQSPFSHVESIRRVG